MKPLAIKHWLILFIIVIIISSLYFLTGSRSQQEKKAIPIKVKISSVIQRDSLVEIQAIGTAQPYATIKIKSLVDGELKSVGFTEGKLVTQNQVLFTIDPRPFEVQLMQAKANLARDESLLDNAIKILERGKSLLDKKNISQQELDQFKTNVEVLKGTIEVDKAAIASAELQLSYCTIRSPVTGYAGQLQFDVGNIINAKDETPLVVINQVVPINVNFSVPEQYVPYIKNNVQNKFLDVTIIPKESKPILAKLSFVDNKVDATTGTILLKASFENLNKELWPGEFVTIKLALEKIKNALLIPSRAIQAGPNGFYVFTVNADNRVQIRNITVGPILNDQTIILSGVNLGDKVVTEGHLRLSEGTLVNYEVEGESENVQIKSTEKVNMPSVAQ